MPFYIHHRLTLVLSLLILIGVGVVSWIHFYPASSPVACTMEARMCPDGSSVGRTGPLCEFAACPSAVSYEAPASWLSTTTNGVSFRYPSDFQTTYIKPATWPPTARITEEPFACAPQDASAVAKGENTIQKTIGGRTYCVSHEAEGAAGSTYLTYTYAFPYAGNTGTLVFTLREPQCGNYDDPQQSACQSERNAFSPDATIDGVAQSVKK